MAIVITSTVFEESAFIPLEHTCDGANQSPPLSWTNVPEETKSLALIVKDPDAPRGTFTHWVLFNLPADIDGLPDGIPADDKLDNGAQHGVNDFGNIGYGGPCPPPGDDAHRYYFRLYVLDRELTLNKDASEQDVTDAIQGHILDEGHLMGKYKRQQR